MQKAFNSNVKENFQNIGNIRGSHIQEGQRTPNRLNPKRSSPRHNVVKLFSTEHKEY